MSSGVIWTAGIYILALRALNLKTVATNIYWRFRANVAIFAVAQGSRRKEKIHFELKKFPRSIYLLICLVKIPGMETAMDV
jgi:hypothetical protein